MMMTQEEKQALEQLRSNHKELAETTIKEVDGGYLIENVMRFLNDDDVIVGMFRDVSVCSYSYEVVNKISELYGTTPTMAEVVNKTKEKANRFKTTKPLRPAFPNHIDDGEDLI